MVDKNEAPEGYEAVRGKVGACCQNCAYENSTNGTCSIWNNMDKGAICMATNRKDKEEVYFIKKSEEDVVEFDKSRVYTALNMDKLELGSTVCLADSLGTLKNRVRDNEYVTLGAIYTDNLDFPFARDNQSSGYVFAYLVAKPVFAFDPSRMYSSWNAEELSKGDRVVVADTIKGLRRHIESKHYSNLNCIRAEDEYARFHSSPVNNRHLNVTSILAYKVD